MDAQHLEGLGRQALNQGEEGTGFDVAHVGRVHIFEDTGRQEAALTVQVSETHDHLVFLSGSRGAAPAFLDPAFDLGDLLRVIVTATSDLTNEHPINHLC